MIKTYEYNPETGLKITGTAQKGVPGRITWTDIETPDQQEISVLEKVFGFHPLAVEDCINMKQRSKLDDYKEYFFIVLHSLSDSKISGKIDTSELGIFVGHGFIVTFHWKKIKAVSQVMERIEKNPELMSKGIDYVLYLIIDMVVDEYFPFLDALDERFSDIEARMLSGSGNVGLNDLFRLKRILLEIRKILSPHREMINALLRYEGLFIRDENRLFYLDIYDHLMRIFDFLDTYRDLLSGSLEIYLTVVSNRMNEIMKTLTVIATIMLPLTLISSIYGMNFRFMPELNWRFGYLWSLGLMLATATGMIYYFRRKNWF